MGFYVAVGFTTEACQESGFSVRVTSPRQGEKRGQSGLRQVIAQGRIQCLDQGGGGRSETYLDPHIVCCVEKSPQNPAPRPTVTLLNPIRQFGKTGLTRQFHPR